LRLVAEVLFCPRRRVCHYFSRCGLEFRHVVRCTFFVRFLVHTVEFCRSDLLDEFKKMTLNPMQKASLAATFAKAQNQQKGQATFLGIKAPLEIEQLSITLNASPIEKTSFRKVLAFVFEYMKGTDVTEHHWAQLKEAAGVDEIILSTVFSGALSLIRTTTRSRTPMETFSSDCIDVLKIPKEFVVEMGLAIQNWYVPSIDDHFPLFQIGFSLYHPFSSTFVGHETTCERSYLQTNHHV